MNLKVLPVLCLRHIGINNNAKQTQINIINNINNKEEQRTSAPDLLRLVLPSISLPINSASCLCLLVLELVLHTFIWLLTEGPIKFEKLNRFYKYLCLSVGLRGHLLL